MQAPLSLQTAPNQESRVFLVTGLLATSLHLSSFSISFTVTYFCYEYNTDLILAGLLEFYCSLHFPKILNYSSHHMHKANSFLLTTDAINSFVTKSEIYYTGKFSITSLTLVINEKTYFFLKQAIQ